MIDANTISRAECVICQFAQGLGKECRTVKLDDDLHNGLGLSSDEGVLLVLEICDEFGIELPDDFNAVVDDCGTKGRRFEQLVEEIQALLNSEE